MPKFNVVSYPDDVKKYFDFLEKRFGYKLKEHRWNDLTHSIVYEGKKKVVLDYDVKDNAFYFFILNNGNKKVTFFDLFKKYEKNISPKKMIPNEIQYLEALKLNAILLEKHGDEILKNG
jgi:hypothetical protein